MIVGLIALFVALDGPAAALRGANNVFKDDIASNAVGRSEIRAGGVAKSEAADDSIGRSELREQGDRDGGLTGNYILESTLGTVPLANRADTLDGLDSNDFTRRACTSQSGALEGFARINADDNFSTSFTTTGVQLPYSCSGQPVQARRVSQGVYEVRFPGVGSRLALVDALEFDAHPSIVEINVSSFAGTPPTFRVQVVNNAGEAPEDIQFVIAVL